MAAGSAVDRKDCKEWTRQHFRGVENLLLPSFAPDLHALDEDGIRRDVRQSIAHGFFGSSCVTLGLDVERMGRFLDLACEEAAGRLLVGVILELPTLEENLRLVRRAAAAGCSHAFLVCPPGLDPVNEGTVYEYCRELIEATDLAIVLYGSPSSAMRRLDPSGIPFALYDRLAELPTVAAIKLTQTMNPVLAYQCCERFAGKLAINAVNLDLLPLLARAYEVRWSGEWLVEAVQSPEKPYAVDFLERLNRGRMDEAIALYWQLQPAYQAFYDLQAPLLRKGGHPWVHMKYHQWCVGGNGGLVRVEGQTNDQIGVLDDAARQRIRRAYERIGITPVDLPEEAFVVGAEGHAKGLRPESLPQRPYYS